MLCLTANTIVITRIKSFVIINLIESFVLGGGFLKDVIDWYQILEVTIVSLICGIVGTETRNAMDMLKIVRHPGFHNLSKEIMEELKRIPFYWRRHLIGIVTAFVAIVTFGIELDALHQAVIALIASLSGNAFLIHHMEEGTAESELYGQDRVVSDNLKSMVNDLRNTSEIAAATIENSEE